MAASRSIFYILLLNDVLSLCSRRLTLDMALVVSFNSLSLLKIFYLVFFVYLQTILIHAYDVVHPDTNSCNPGYGHPLIGWPCEIALSDIPSGSVLKTFSTEAKTKTDDWEQLPQRYVDNIAKPACVITVELEGHSQSDVSVTISYDMIRNIAINVMENCIHRLNWGGWETFGLDATFRALVPPTGYDGSIPGQASAVENPDGSIDSVGLPEGTSGVDGFSEYLTGRISANDILRGLILAHDRALIKGLLLSTS